MAGSSKTPPTPQEVKAGLTAAATQDLRSSLQVELAAEAIIRRVAEISDPATAKTKAGEAKGMAESAKTAVGAVRTAWTTFQSATDMDIVQSRAIEMSGKAAEADAFIAQANSLLEQAETLVRGVKSNDDLINEVVQFRSDVETAEDAIGKIYNEVGEVHKNTPTTESKAAVDALKKLKTEVGKDYTDARTAEDNAKAATDRAGVETAHTDARKAKVAAQAKEQSAKDEQRKVNRAEPSNPPSKTSREKSLALAKSGWGIVGLSCIGLGVLLLIEYLLLKRRLPEGKWYLLPMIVFLLFGAATIGGLIKEKGWTRQIAASLVTFQVVFVGVFVILGALNTPGSDNGGNTDAPSAVTNDPPAQTDGFKPAVQPTATPTPTAEPSN